MITGFEEQTAELTDIEKKQARRVYDIMRKAFSRDESISNAQIREEAKHRFGFTLTGPRVRKMINWMHTEGHLPLLIATSKGYAWAKTQQDLYDYQKSLDSRINSIQSRRKAVSKAIAELNNQRQQSMDL